MKIKYLIMCMLYFVVSATIFSKEIISTIGFSNHQIGTSKILPIEVRKMNIKSDYWLSPNKKYKAFCVNESEIFITDLDEKVIYYCLYDEQMNIFPDSSNVYIIGWSSDSKCLWFWSIDPVGCAYFAKVDLVLTETHYYSNLTGINGYFYDYCFDLDNSVLFYSNFKKNYGSDENPNKSKKITLLAFLITEQKSIIIDSQMEKHFKPFLIDKRKVSYFANNKTEYYEY